MTRNSWHGVYSAITTKFDSGEEIDLKAVREDVAFQIGGGVDGIICCGSLGEASTLETEEKIAIAAAAQAEAAGKVPVMLTIAEDSTRAATRLAKKADELGLDGLMVLPAMRYVSRPQETIAHFRAVAGASDQEIMVYNNPVAYAVDVTPAMFAEMADETKFVAIKESSADLRRITDIINRTDGRYQIFTGVDDLAFESLLLGAVGWVAGLVCAFPRETVAIHRLVERGQIEDARAIYRWFMPLLHLDFSPRFVQNIKLAEHVVRGTSPTVRAPRHELEGAERDEVIGVVRTALDARPDVARYGL